MVNFHIVGRGSLSLVIGTTLVASDWSIHSVMFVLLLVPDLQRKFLSIAGGARSGRTRTQGSFHGSLPLCAPSNVYGDPSVYRGDILVAWLLVWIDFCCHLFVHTRKTSGLGRANVIERASRLRGLYGAGEISFHSICLVIFSFR